MVYKISRVWTIFLDAFVTPFLYNATSCNVSSSTPSSRLKIHLKISRSCGQPPESIYNSFVSNESSRLSHSVRLHFRRDIPSGFPEKPITWSHVHMLVNTDFTFLIVSIIDKEAICGTLDWESYEMIHHFNVFAI